MNPQPVTQQVVSVAKTLFLAARHTGLMNSLKVTVEDRRSRVMSLSSVLALKWGWGMMSLTVVVISLGLFPSCVIFPKYTRSLDLSLLNTRERKLENKKMI